MASAKWKKFSKIKVTSTFSPTEEGEVEVETVIETTDENSEKEVVVETKPKQYSRTKKKLLKG